MTAVEWLINELHKKEQGLVKTSYNHIFDAAKEMEKQQIIEAANLPIEKEGKMIDDWLDQYDDPTITEKVSKESERIENEKLIRVVLQQSIYEESISRQGSGFSQLLAEITQSQEPSVARTLSDYILKLM